MFLMIEIEVGYCLVKEQFGGYSGDGDSIYGDSRQYYSCSVVE